MNWCKAFFKKYEDFGLILEKLAIGHYPGHDLFRTLENILSGKMKANRTLEKFRFYKISRVIRKTWSRLLIRTISREPFEKTVKHMTKITKFWKKSEFPEINQNWSLELP